MPLIDFGHPHDTRIGERHRSVPIFLMQLAQGGDVLVDVECDHERTIFEKPEQCIMRPGETREQIAFRAVDDDDTSDNSLRNCGGVRP